MKGKLTLLAGCLALLGSVMANAQSLVFQTDQPYVPGTSYMVKGSLTNDGSDDIFNIAGSVTLSVPSNVATSPLISLLTQMAPDPLAMNDTYDGDLFQIDVDANATGVIEGSFLVNYSDVDGDYELGPVSFRINPTAVPEPGTVAMLASGLVGAAFVARRRRK